MSDLTLWHGLVIVIVLILAGIPIGRILRRMGHRPWWLVAFLVPGVSLIAIWVLAFVKWPAVDRP